MNDYNIREILRTTELSKYLNDTHSKVVEEMKLPITGTRIDMAVINEKFHGYEIKSASDTLNRLPHQLIGYEKVFDYLSVVTEEKHYKKIETILPSWVGLHVCYEASHNRQFKTIRKPTLNTNQEGFFIAKLLWREEIVDVLNAFNINFRSKDRNWLLCEAISQNIPLASLSRIVREKLKQRTSWRD